MILQQLWEEWRAGPSYGLPGQQPKITKRGSLLDADLGSQFDAYLHAGPKERRCQPLKPRISASPMR